MSYDVWNSCFCINSQEFCKENTAGEKVKWHGKAKQTCGKSLYPKKTHLQDTVEEGFKVFFKDPERYVKGIFRSHFFPYVRMYVRKFCEIQFFWKIYLWDTSYDHLWSPSEPEVNQKWTGIGSEVECEGSTRTGHLRTEIFFFLTHTFLDFRFS